MDSQLQRPQRPAGSRPARDPAEARYFVNAAPTAFQSIFEMIASATSLGPSITDEYPIFQVILPMRQPGRQEWKKSQPEKNRSEKSRSGNIHPENNQWMSALPDDLLISDINIPGSHNAAAINTRKRTRWACQDHSITEQLQQGIRLLDIRLKPKRHQAPTETQTLAVEPAGTYYFLTCHGHLGLGKHNEFQSFDTLLEECATFLQKNETETIILTIQIDDWRKTRKKDRPQILQILQGHLKNLPLVTGPHLPTTKECRGKIYLINRINDDPTLGVPINIPDNTPGTTLKRTGNRNYEVYIQDQYKRLNKRQPKDHKLRLTIKAFEEKAPGTVLLNFASATKPFGRFVYIMRELQAYLSKNSKEKPQGWLLLDYCLEEDIPALIIASNFTSYPSGTAPPANPPY